MRTVFVDAGALIALVSPRDRLHDIATQAARNLAEPIWITTELVVAEAATRLRYDVGHRQMLRLRAFLGSRPRLRLLRSDERIDAAAWDLLERVDDLTLSYSDAVTSVVAKRERCDAIFTFDRDFLVLGHSVYPANIAREDAPPYVLTPMRPLP